MSRRALVFVTGVVVCVAVVMWYLVDGSTLASSPRSTDRERMPESTERVSNARGRGGGLGDLCRHPFLPLAVGTRWRYRAQAPAASGVEALYVDREVISLERSGDGFVATVRTTLSVAGRPDSTSREVRVACAPDGAVDDVLDDLGDDAMFSPSGPAPQLPRDLSLGTSFDRVSEVVLRLPMLGPDAAQVHVEIRGMSRVVRRERVETPVGAKDAWVVERREEFTLRPDPEIAALAEEEGTSFPGIPARTVRSYLAEGIGLVRRETVQAGQRVEWTLEQFCVGR